MKRPIGADKLIARKACTSCGALGPERQDYPFTGHRRTCSLVAMWRREHRAKGRARFTRLAKSLPDPGSVLATATPPIDLDDLLRRLKLRAAHWRRKANKFSELDQFANYSEATSVACGLDEAIAIVKAVSERGVRRKRRNV